MSDISPGLHVEVVIPPRNPAPDARVFSCSGRRVAAGLGR